MFLRSLQPNRFIDCYTRNVFHSKLKSTPRRAMSSHTNDLFLPPSTARPRLAPTVWPGGGPDATAALQKVLKDNHERWHIFFNEDGFHNHNAHRALSIWALGASASVIESAYEADCSYQRPISTPSEAITIDNFTEHLGDERFYGAYLKFFDDVVRQEGVAATLEKFVFSRKYNYQPTRGMNEQPQMLNRFLDGLFHAMIHTGLGIEFGMLGVVAEGLAQAAVHDAKNTPFVPYAFINDGLTSIEKTSSRIHLRPSAVLYASTNHTHAFDILARIINDPVFDQDSKSRSKKRSEALKKYADEWEVNSSDPQEIDKKIEELAWTTALLYGAGGFEAGQTFKNDFGLMHLVTSSLFLPSIIPLLTPLSQAILLRTYLTVSLGWWISGGRRPLDITGFFALNTTHPAPLGPLPTPSDQALPSPRSPAALTPNPWLPLLQTTLVHPDEHLAKIQRALAHWAALYGARPAGQPDFCATKLAGAELLDGTLFLRCAILTAERMGRVREGEAAGSWVQ